MNSEPRKISTDDTARALLETALLSFAAREDVHIPRKPDLAEFLWQRAVQPLLEELGRRPPVDDDPACGNTMYCHNTDEHNTHVWTPPWNPLALVRCPGRDGI